MPTPILVYGTVRDSTAATEANAIITFSLSSTVSVTTDSSGNYAIDLSEIDVAVGDTVSYSAQDKFNNESYTGSFVATESYLLNISLSVREAAFATPGNRGIQIFNIGGKPVSRSNPFPVVSV